MVATDGMIEAHYEYNPFGNTIAAYGDSADANPFRFSTKYFDDEVDLYYYGPQILQAGDGAVDERRSGRFPWRSQPLRVCKEQSWSEC